MQNTKRADNLAIANLCCFRRGLPGEINRVIVFLGGRA